MIYLIGYMACGKTTLGRALSRAGDLRFVDLDEMVVQEAGKSIPRIFAEDGEDAFRALERAVLSRVAASPDDNLIVACGGGTPCADGAMALMLASGTVVWLRASIERTIARINDAPGQRPLLDGLSPEQLRRKIEQGLAAREPFYSRAHAVFDSSCLDTQSEIDSSVAQFLNRFIITA